MISFKKVIIPSIIVTGILVAISHVNAKSEPIEKPVQAQERTTYEGIVYQVVKIENGVYEAYNEADGEYITFDDNKLSTDTKELQVNDMIAGLYKNNNLIMVQKLN